MYKKISLLLVLFCSCFLISCRTTRQEVKKTETQNQTTSEKVVSYKDTIVVAPKSETSLKIAVAEFAFKPGLNMNSKPRVYTQKNGNATARIKIVHDTITVTATCDSLAIVAKIKSELLKESNSSKTNDSENIKQTKGFSFWNLITAFALGFGVCFILKLFKII
jgi:hypothetical protein